VSHYIAFSILCRALQGISMHDIGHVLTQHNCNSSFLFPCFYSQDYLLLNTCSNFSLSLCLLLRSLISYFSASSYFFSNTLSKKGVSPVHDLLLRCLYEIDLIPPPRISVFSFCADQYLFTKFKPCVRETTVIFCTGPHKRWGKWASLQSKLNQLETAGLRKQLEETKRKV